MQRGIFDFPYPTGRNAVQQVVASSGAFTTNGGNGTMKPSIILFDTRPGAHTFTPSVTMRARVFVVGGGSVSGGGYSEKVLTLVAGVTYNYTVGAAGSGAADGGTSVWNSGHQATGGKSIANGYAAGQGSLGDINTDGGVGGTGGGGASGHRFGDGFPGGTGGGGGWSQPGGSGGGTSCVDGWGLGLIPGSGGIPPSAISAATGGYGCGGGVGTSSSATIAGGDGGIGGGGGFGGGATNGIGGLGGGGASAGPGAVSGGNGVVGIEVLS